MFKKRAIKKYIKHLPPELGKRYGSPAPYTEAQVTRTVNDLKLSKKHIKYAYALFCSEQTLAEIGYTQSQVADFQSFFTNNFSSGSPIGSGSFGMDGGFGGDCGGGDGC